MQGPLCIKRIDEGLWYLIAFIQPLASKNAERLIMHLITKNLIHSKSLMNRNKIKITQGYHLLTGWWHWGFGRECCRRWRRGRRRGGWVRFCYLIVFSNGWVKKYLFSQRLVDAFVVVPLAFQFHLLVVGHFIYLFF